MQVKQIAFHPTPHFDECVAVAVLRRYGREQFPGVENAPIVFWANGGTPDGRSAEAWEAEGVLAVGVGGGRFDEHPAPGNTINEKAGDCAATLVAKFLEVDEHPALQSVLKFAKQTDQGPASPWDISSAVKVMHSLHPNTPHHVVRWTLEAVDAYLSKDEKFWSEGKTEFERAAQVETVRGPDGRSFKVVTVQSDSEVIAKFARSPFGCGAAVVIVRGSKGLTQIYTTKRLALPPLDDCAAMIRRAEETAYGEAGYTQDEALLRADGKIPGPSSVWFYHRNGQQLLNGSMSAPNVPPSRLALPVIREKVAEWLSRTPRPVAAASSSRR